MENSYRSIAQVSSTLAGEVFAWNPENLDVDSHEKIAWKCHNGHLWVEKIINRFKDNSQCPTCIRKNKIE